MRYRLNLQRRLRLHIRHITTHQYPTVDTSVSTSSKSTASADSIISTTNVSSWRTTDDSSTAGMHIYAFDYI